jgi:hypothetical protein
MGQCTSLVRVGQLGGNVLGQNTMTKREILRRYYTERQVVLNNEMYFLMRTIGPIVVEDIGCNGLRCPVYKIGDGRVQWYDGTQRVYECVQDNG